MKKITTFLGCVGVVCLISGCSSDADDLEKIVLPNQPTAEVASSSNSNSSISSATAATSNSSNSGASNPTSSGNQSTDSPSDTVHKEVVIKSEPGDYPDPYFSSGVFCWSEECEKEWAGKSSASAPKSSSSMTIDIGMSVEAPVLPTVTETQMLDNRDQNVYSLVRIGGVHWMAENIRYESSSGYYCKAEDGTDMCAKYGGYYNYATAQRVCPTGWRLPTQAEVESAKAAVEFEWWTIGGRFEIYDDGSTKYGQAEEQGRYWLTTTTSNSVRIENYSGKEFNFESPDGSTRAYNVRCVEAQ